MKGRITFNAFWWRVLVILLLTAMVSINLRILLTAGDSEEEIYDVVCSNSKQTRADVMLLNASETWTEWSKFDPSQAKVLGYRREKEGFLTIGIPSIKRENDAGLSYLLHTLHSIVKNARPRDIYEVVVIVFLADFDLEYNQRVIRKITAIFMDELNIGFFQIVQASRYFYPNLDGLKHNFKDTEERVQWRAKQVSDYSFMFLYGRNLSRYYMQLEDDVMCAPNFITAIRDFIKNQKKPWVVLEFSELGFIGKLFRSETLPKLSQFLLTFYDEQPVDWLIRYFRMTMAQEDMRLRKPTIFQHIGLTSSFDTSKQNKLKDRFFDSGVKPYQGDDPAAHIATSMEGHDEFVSELAYGSGSGYFWTKDSKRGDVFYVIFESDDIYIDRIAVVSGHSDHPKDVIKHGAVELSPRMLKMDGARVTCADWVRIGTLQKGMLDVSNVQDIVKGKVSKCLKVLLLEDHNSWVIIQQIAVFTKK